MVAILSRGWWVERGFWIDLHAFRSINIVRLLNYYSIQIPDGNFYNCLSSQNLLLAHNHVKTFIQTINSLPDSFSILSLCPFSLKVCHLWYVVLKTCNKGLWSYITRPCNWVAFNTFALRRRCSNLKWVIFKLMSRIDILSINCKFAYQAVTSTNAEKAVCCHMVSLGQNELTHWGLVMPYGIEDLGQHWFR